MQDFTDLICDLFSLMKHVAGLDELKVVQRKPKSYKSCLSRRRYSSILDWNHQHVPVHPELWRSLRPNSCTLLT